MSATVIERRAELATLVAAAAERRAEVATLTSEQFSRRAEYTDLENLMTDRLAQTATLHAAVTSSARLAQAAALSTPFSFVETSLDHLTYRSYYQLFQPGTTVIVHGIRYKGQRWLPHRCVVTLRQDLTAGGGIYIESYDDTVIRVRVWGTEPVRADLFAFLPHSITEPPLVLPP